MMRLRCLPRPAAVLCVLQRAQRELKLQSAFTSHQWRWQPLGAGLTVMGLCTWMATGSDGYLQRRWIFRECQKLQEGAEAAEALPRSFRKAKDSVARQGAAIEDATQRDVHREFQNDELNAFLMLLCAAHAAGAQEVQEYLNPISVLLASRPLLWYSAMPILRRGLPADCPELSVLEDCYQKCVRKYLHGARCRLQEASVLKLRRMRQQETLYSFARFIVAFIGVALGCKNDERNDLCFIAFRDYMKSITLASSDAVGVEEARKTYVRNFDIATEMCLTWTHRSFRWLLLWRLLGLWMQTILWERPDICFGRNLSVDVQVENCIASTSSGEGRSSQSSPLHLAAKHGQVQVCRALLNNVATKLGFLTSKDRRGYTPLHQAALLGQAEVVALLQSAHGLGSSMGDGEAFHDCLEDDARVVRVQWYSRSAQGSGGALATHSLVLVTTAAGRGYVIEKAAMPDELVQEEQFQNGVVVSDIRGFHYFGTLVSGSEGPELKETLTPLQLWQAAVDTGSYSLGRANCQHAAQAMFRAARATTQPVPPKPNEIGIRYLRWVVDVSGPCCAYFHLYSSQSMESKTWALLSWFGAISAPKASKS